MRTGKLLFQVLKELVAVLVGTDERSGLGVTCFPSAIPLHFHLLLHERTDVLYTRGVSISHVYE